MQYHHLFFHSLVVEPAKAFRKNPNQSTSFETWMITVTEYKRLLKSLYDRNYVLVKMADLLRGKVQLPEGKIPLVLSYDDVNYYDYMKGFGFADKLVVTEAGKIANEWVEEDGTISVSRELDGVPLLENFIEEHPDFSWEGARGIPAVTGFEGALGYRDLQGEKEQLKQVVAALKKLGWEFACHSYAHKRDVFADENADESLCIEDTKRWLEEVGAIVGDANIYISPFGIKTRNYSRFDEYLRTAGFRYFCDVNNTRNYENDQGYFYFPRINIDGFLFQHRNYEFECYYGKLTEIIDDKSTKEYPLYKKNAQSLAKHARVCLRMPTTYLWGGLGEVITEEVIEDRQKEYPKTYDETCCERLREKIGKGVYGFDCSGLIKNFLMGGIPNYRYDAKYDWNSSMLLERAEKSGSMDSLPEQPGVCLYMPGHVGIYMGKQKVIEATSNVKFGDGVVETKVSDREWTHWFYCPTISYER